jgi:hypothetical protein
MVSYIRFGSAAGEVLVEVDEDEVSAGDPQVGSGELNAGLVRQVREKSGQLIAVAQATFEDAVQNAVRLNVAAFLAAAEGLKPSPTQMEITFGLKGTGALSNVAVGKLGGELNYHVKMVWKSSDSLESPRSTVE